MAFGQLSINLFHLSARVLDVLPLSLSFFGSLPLDALTFLLLRALFRGQGCPKLADLIVFLPQSSNSVSSWRSKTSFDFGQRKQPATIVVSCTSLVDVCVLWSKTSLLWIDDGVHVCLWHMLDVEWQF